MIKLNAFAKLNVNLHILPQKLKNGLYPVRFINCQLDLHDELVFESIEDKIEIIADNPQLPKAEDNLIYKAAVLLKKSINNPKLGAKIFLKKNIPIKAGLGGGSSDAAMAIKGLSKLWHLKPTKNQLVKLAENLGKDIFYCLKGGLCEISGDGSIVNSLKMPMPVFWLAIITPEEKKPSTKWMYENVDVNTIGKNLDTIEVLKKEISNKNKKRILANLFNDFESSAVKRFPVIRRIKNDLLKTGAIASILAGSGMSVAGFFINKKQSLEAFNRLKVKYKQTVWIQTKS